jgi:hypothetical protein
MRIRAFFADSIVWCSLGFELLNTPRVYSFPLHIYRAIFLSWIRLVGASILNPSVSFPSIMLTFLVAGTTTADSHRQTSRELPQSFSSYISSTSRSSDFLIRVPISRLNIYRPTTISSSSFQNSIYAIIFIFSTYHSYKIRRTLEFEPDNHSKRSKRILNDPDDHDHDHESNELMNRRREKERESLCLVIPKTPVSCSKFQFQNTLLPKRPFVCQIYAYAIWCNVMSLYIYCDMLRRAMLRSVPCIFRYKSFYLFQHILYAVWFSRYVVLYHIHISIGG